MTVDAPATELMSHIVTEHSPHIEAPLINDEFKSGHVRFGPLLQLLFQVLPGLFGLKSQRVPHQVDAFFGAIDQRRISCGDIQLMLIIFIGLND